ncbi:hypothetical protein [Actinomadura rugatobispora]|uniref:Uncharacterized protein n=1 Tax=Actinomadura rugatobispora TaxID=1994 RepID=A0ABW1A704_9ACTN|nr:hypothetical protein GCM10010200_012840 [Actinomadura rugatobispora]
MTIGAAAMGIAALVLLGWARFLPAGPGSAARWSRTGVIMIAGSLLLLALAVWMASSAG